MAAPTEATLKAAKEAWLDARDVYGPTEVFRFYDGPIDNPDDGPEGQINAWPMDEAYVDYVEDDPEAGIINDTAGVPEITTDVLVAANEEGGETNISTGWHAIEFLLWGQDLSEDGPGARPVTDYTTSPTAERRAAYLTAVTDLLVDDLTASRDQWDPEGGAYREEFLADPTGRVNILRGMGALSPASSPASASPSPTRPRTRRTSTPASPTTPSPTSSTTPTASRWRTRPSTRASTAHRSPTSWPRSTPSSTPS